jgi:hypothetical protein
MVETNDAPDGVECQFLNIDGMKFREMPNTAGS